MKNCQNGGKTILDLKDGPDSDPYRCKCAPGYRGDLCEIGRYNDNFASLKLGAQGRKNLSQEHRYGGCAASIRDNKCETFSDQILY